MSEPLNGKTKLIVSLFFAIMSIATSLTAWTLHEVVQQGKEISGIAKTVEGMKESVHDVKDDIRTLQGYHAKKGN